MQRSMTYILVYFKHTFYLGKQISQKCEHIASTSHGNILHASQASHVSYKMPESVFKWSTNVKANTRRSLSLYEKDPQNRRTVRILRPSWVPGGGVAKSVFDSFLSPGVPGTPLGRPWDQNGPKTSPKSLRDLCGHQFFIVFDACFG